TVGILAANGNDASAGVTGNGGGDVTITGGVDALVTIDATFGNVVFSNVGDVIINADRLHIDGGSGIGALQGEVTIKPVTAGRFINLGSALEVTPATLELSDVELDTVHSPLLRIGSDTTGTILVSSQITAAGYATLSLIGNNIVDATPAEQSDLTVKNLALRAKLGIGDADDLDTTVTNLAYLNGGNQVNIFNTGDLFITVL